MKEKVDAENSSVTNLDIRKEQTFLKRFLPLIFLGALAILAVSQGWHRFLTLEQLLLHRETLAAYVADYLVFALVGFMTVYVVVVALSLPGGALLTIAGGFLFGWIAGGLSVVFAATLGATILFLIARSSFGEVIAARAGPWLEKLSKGFHDDAFHYLLFLRLVPAFPFWLVNLAPALLNVKLRTYITATFIGIIPGTFAFAFLGSGLDSVIEAQQMANRDCIPNSLDCTFQLSIGALVTPELLIALGALGIIALFPIVFKKFRSRSSTKGSSD